MILIQASAQFEQLPRILIIDSSSVLTLTQMPTAVNQVTGS